MQKMPINNGRKIRIMNTDVVNNPYAERLSLIEDKIERALKASGRTRDAVQLCAVSKTVDCPEVDLVYQLGVRLFGENRPQELVRKHETLTPTCPEIVFHMIGNLQTNKINHVLRTAQMIHSISSAELAQSVSERALRAEICMPVLLEVNVSGELSKSGFSPQALERELDRLWDLPGIQVSGLMTMAPQGDPVQARKTFEGLRLLRDKLAHNVPSHVHLSELSMGMSEDFESALEEGATIVRLGRTIFDLK